MIARQAGANKQRVPRERVAARAAPP